MLRGLIYAALIFPLYAYSQEAPYYLSVGEYYGVSGGAACLQFPPGLVDDRTIGGLKYRAVYSRSETKTNGGRQDCTFVFEYINDTSYTKADSGLSGGVPIYARQSAAACEADENQTIDWPLARRVSSDPSVPLQAFGVTPPLEACFSGCAADRLGISEDVPHSYPDSETPEIIYVKVDYRQTGAACNASSSSPPMPDLPPPPGQESGDTGGGDTGGGDTGGGTGGTGGDTGGGTGGTGGDTGGGTGGTGGDTGGGTGGTGGDTGGDTGGGTGGDTGDGDGNSAGGLACNQPLTCEGDAIQCAILRTQKEQLCADLDGADFEGHKGEIESLFSGPDFQREADEEVTVPSFVTGITRFFPSNSCPADAAVSLSSFGGRTLKFSFEPICSFATALGPLIVVAATVFAALYVGRAFGGE